MVWGIYIDELIQQKNITALNNFAANAEFYPLQDLLYRTTGLADSAGTVREAYDCDAYGNTLVFRNGGSPPAAIAYSDADTQVVFPTCDAIFTGQRYDAETNLYLYRMRVYAPSLGRFVQRDPLLDLVNTYIYVDNNPLFYLDLTGLQKKSASQLEIEQWATIIAQQSGMKDVPLDPSVVQYWESFRKQNPKLSGNQIRDAIKNLLAGCIGITAVNIMNLNNFGLPEFDSCYRDIDLAIALRDKWRKEHTCCTDSKPESKPFLYSMHYWWNAPFEEKAGKVDPTEWAKAGSKGRPDIGPMAGNFDYGWPDNQDKPKESEWYHANVAHGQGGKAMAIKKSSYKDWIAGFDPKAREGDMSKTYYNDQLFCVVCDNGAFFGRQNWVKPND